jgi:hypothetical protein
MICHRLQFMEWLYVQVINGKCIGPVSLPRYVSLLLSIVS